MVDHEQSPKNSATAPEERSLGTTGLYRITRHHLQEEKSDNYHDILEAGTLFSKLQNKDLLSKIQLTVAIPKDVRSSLKD